MRVVFDTNIFISALIFPDSAADETLRKVIQGEDQLIISKAILDELLGVLARKFSRDREALARVAVLLADIGLLVRPGHKINVLSDEADNRILECAVKGQTDIIITGDQALLNLGNYTGIKILSLRKYLDM